jgi:putative endonuclease
MNSGQVVELVSKALDRMSRVVRRSRQQEARHLEAGREGEEHAYFLLRREGYKIIARNWRTKRRKGELDLVGWENGTLCFVEVKTRSSKAVKPAEAAVDEAKRRELIEMAREFMRRIPAETPLRFDVISVYVSLGHKPEMHLFKNAFSWRRMR